MAQDTGLEWVTGLKKSIWPQISGVDPDSGRDPPGLSGAYVIERERGGRVTPFRVVDFLTNVLQGCRCAPRPGYSNCIPPGCAYTGASEIPEVECNFSSQGAAGECLMRQECPDFLRGAGHRGGGVKAVEGSRSPSPGGIAAHLGSDECSGELRRCVSEANPELMGMREIPESRGGFVLHNAEGEWVTRQKCPGFPRWREAAPHRNAPLCAPRENPGNSGVGV